jgi:hypothetical protein
MPLRAHNGLRHVAAIDPGHRGPHRNDRYRRIEAVVLHQDVVTATRTSMFSVGIEKPCVPSFERTMSLTASPTETCTVECSYVNRLATIYTS